MENAMNDKDKRIKNALKQMKKVASGRVYIKDRYKKRHEVFLGNPVGFSEHR